MGDYFQLLKENRFQVHPTKYAMSVLVGMCTVMNSGLAFTQRLAFGNKIANAKLSGPPVFIIGHWRSGTTLMHELISLDERFNFPSNFEAFVPAHFLISRPMIYPLISMLMPAQRPMDNMSMGAGSPQEDDFALIGLGAPTPYRRMAFANRVSRDHLELNFDHAKPATEQKLREAMEGVFKNVDDPPSISIGLEVAAAHRSHRPVGEVVSRCEIHPPFSASLQAGPFDDAVVDAVRRTAELSGSQV